MYEQLALDAVVAGGLVYVVDDDAPHAQPAYDCWHAATSWPTFGQPSDA